MKYSLISSLVLAAAAVSVSSSAFAEGPVIDHPVPPHRTATSKVPADRDLAGGRTVPSTGLVANKKSPSAMARSEGKGSPSMPGGLGTGSKTERDDTGAGGPREKAGTAP